MDEPQRYSILLFHSTCCYFDDTVKLNARLEDQLRDLDARFIHLMTIRRCCSYYLQLDPPRSAICAATYRKVRDWLAKKVEGLFLLEDYLPSDCEPIPLPCDWDSLANAEFRGMHMWGVIEASLAARLQWDGSRPCRGQTGDEAWEAALQLLAAACDSTVAVDRFLDIMRPTHCILFNGHFFLERVMLERCRLHGVQTIAVENSTFANRKHYSLTGAAGNQNELRGTGGDLSKVRRLSDAQSSRVREFFERKLFGLNGVIPLPPPSISHKRDVGLADDRPVLLFLAQVPHDSVMVADAACFKGQIDAIDWLLEAFSSELASYNLLIRLHPGGEKSAMREDVLSSRYPSGFLSSNVRVFAGQECNTYDLMRIADAGITFTSQAGLEFLSLMKPLITLGNAYYSGHGFTFDVRRSAALKCVLISVLENPVLDADIERRIETFLYHLVFEYLVPIDRAAGMVTPKGESMIRNILCGRHRLHGIPPA